MTAVMGIFFKFVANRGARGLVIALGKSLESHAAGFTHYYSAWENLPSVVCK